MVNYEQNLAEQLGSKLTQLQNSSFIFNDEEYNLNGFEEEVEAEIEAMWAECQDEIEAESD